MLLKCILLKIKEFEYLGLLEIKNSNTKKKYLDITAALCMQLIMFEHYTLFSYLISVLGLGNDIDRVCV